MTVIVIIIMIIIIKYFFLVRPPPRIFNTGEVNDVGPFDDEQAALLVQAQQAWLFKHPSKTSNKQFILALKSVMWFWNAM